MKPIYVASALLAMVTGTLARVPAPRGHQIRIEVQAPAIIILEDVNCEGNQTYCGGTLESKYGLFPCDQSLFPHSALILFGQDTLNLISKR